MSFSSYLPSSVGVDRVLSAIMCEDVGLEGVRAAHNLGCSSNVCESEIFVAFIEEVISMPVNTVCRIPQSVRPLLAQVLSSELKHACYDGLWGFARLHMFAKAALRSPPQGAKRKRYVVSALLKSRLQQWHNGCLVSLWEEVRSEAGQQFKSTSYVNTDRSLQQSNARRATF